MEEFKVNTEIILLKLFELLLLCTVLSSVATVLNLFGVIIARYQVLLLLGSLCLLFLIANIVSVKNLYHDVVHNIFLCYRLNFISYFLFGMINVYVYLFLPNTVYTWMFAITKFMRYTPLAFSAVHSAVVFHILNAIVILVTPLIMRWIFTDALPIEEDGIPIDIPPFDDDIDYFDDEDDF